MLHNAHPKRNIGSAKRGELSEAKSGTSTFAPSLTTVIIFRRIGSHDRYRKRGLHLPMDEKTGQGLEEMQGGNIKAFRPQSD